MGRVLTHGHVLGETGGQGLLIVYETSLEAALNPSLEWVSGLELQVEPLGEYAILETKFYNGTSWKKKHFVFVLGKKIKLKKGYNQMEVKVWFLNVSTQHNHLEG
jgi:hypothetical protein